MTAGEAADRWLDLRDAFARVAGLEIWVPEPDADHAVVRLGRAVLLLAAARDVPVCPHAGGIGLCEYVQHISVIDHLCVSGSLVDRTTEYASHLHEHFIHPAQIRNGAYVVPEDPGYSIEMRTESIEMLSYPGGAEWR